MAHPLVFGLFPDSVRAAAGVQAARRLGVGGVHLSIVTRTHGDEVAFAKRYGGSPGADLEDSRPAARLAELGAEVVAALALVLPGIGPIVAGGPLATELGEIAGHAAGHLTDVLKATGVDAATAELWQERVGQGSILVGAHMAAGNADEIETAFVRAGAVATFVGTWTKPTAT